MPLTPETWLNQFTVNLTVADDQSDPEILQLANGNILVSWTSSNNSGVGSDSGLDVIGQIFDPLGNRIGGEIQLNNSFFFDDEQNMELAALPGGRLRFGVRRHGRQRQPASASTSMMQTAFKSAITAQS